MSAVTIAEKTKGCEKMSGYVTLYWDTRAGKMWLELDKLEREMLYYPSLPAGLGSNDIGLDRGLLGQEAVVKFERSGNRVLLVAQNYAYRAVTTDAAERRAVADSFGRSTLWGFTVEAEDEGRVLVDATNFFLQDASGVAARLKQANQGTFKLEASRSAFFLERTRAFPKNTEVEVTLTFTSDNPGAFVEQVAPVGSAITIRQHHSFVELPDAGYRPRAHDPRAGYISTAYFDFSSPFTEKIERRFVIRHRLQKKDPAARVSEAVKPLVYYVDRGAPEPIRTALVEGARWWAEAFEAAGFRNAYRVELLPEGADPMDIRYNVIEWVHRATRGWSYGAAVTDPRTGEILKGKVTLGSQRIRQDYLIAEGLLAPYEGAGREKMARDMALQRIRQLSAHEIGHTLGLVHNFAASTSERASVMDYPHPLVLMNTDGTVDLSRAYTNSIGAWDKTAIAWGYGQFAPGTDERKALTAMLEDSWKRGVPFIADADSVDGGAHPLTHVWDSGPDAVVELRRMMEIRQKALERFGEANIRMGAPMASLETVLVPLYLGHRYQVAAAAKTLGGLQYTYALRGDGQAVTALIAPDRQKAALDALLATLEVKALELPERIVRLIPPRPTGAIESQREMFRRRTGVAFDALAPAETAASLTVGLMLHPQRVARIVEHHERDGAQPSLESVVEALLGVVFRPEGQPAGAVQRVVDNVVLYHLMSLASNEQAPAQARAIVLRRLGALQRTLAAAAHNDEAQATHMVAAGAALERFLKNPTQPTVMKPLEAPPGAPI